MMVVLSHVVLLIYTFTISFDFSACKLATKLLFFNIFCEEKKRGVKFFSLSLYVNFLVRNCAPAEMRDAQEILTTPI